jgi:hypothetical protein
MDVPHYQNFGTSDYRQFKSDVDHYVTQIMLDNSMRSRRNSVEILPASKDRIRSYVHGLRDCIEKSNMTQAKRRGLLNKLDAFERELEKRRVGILAATLLTFEILAIPGGTWASAEVAQKLVTSVMQVMAEAKAKEDEARQLPAKDVPKALTPPRTMPEKKAAPSPDLDDEIPF